MRQKIRGFQAAYTVYQVQNVRARQCSKPARHDVARDVTVTVTSMRTAVCRLFGSSENSVLKKLQKITQIID